VVAGVEEVGVDVEGDGGLGVAHRGGDEDDRGAGGDEQRGERVAQVVSAQRRALAAAQTGGVDRRAQDARA